MILPGVPGTSQLAHTPNLAEGMMGAIKNGPWKEVFDFSFAKQMKLPNCYDTAGKLSSY